ncbi:MAG: ATP synthase F1 subunit epsilon [Miltoncostaeaceae bacterium]
MSTAVGTERRTLSLRLLTPEGPVFDGAAYMVIAPSIQGEVGILPRHAAFIAQLRVGDVRVTLPDDTKQVFATTTGFISVEDDNVLVLVEQAELASDIDVPRAQAALQRAEQGIAEAGDDALARTTAEGALRRAQNRLRVAEGQ